MSSITQTTYTPEQIVELLNEFEVNHPIVGDPGNQPHDIWEDLILKLDGYNDFATMVIDPKERGDRFVANFRDRQVQFRYDDKSVSWSITDTRLLT
jgi:hypothetical protein